MLAKRNEQIFKVELIVLDYLIYQYKSELKKTRSDSDKGKEYKATKKTRIIRLRLEIEALLKQIEKDLPSQDFSLVEEYF